jgi:hypothetical protein
MAQPQYANTNPKDWKRRSKRKDPQGRWLRVFHNKATGDMISLVEVEGGLGIAGEGSTVATPAPNQAFGPGTPPTAGTPDSPVYFNATELTAFTAESEWGGLADAGNFVLVLTTRDYWNEHHCQIDHTPPELQAALDSLPFTIYEEMDTTYIITPEQLQAIQTNPLFYASPAFTAFLNSLGSMEA